MKLVIKEEKLKLLLEKHKDQIGKKKDTVGSLVMLFSLIIAVAFATYDSIWFLTGDQVRLLAWVITIAVGIWVIYNIFNKSKKKCTIETLYNEIYKESDVGFESIVIIIIKNEFENYSSKYLVFRDSVNACSFFPYIRVKASEQPKTELELTNFKLDFKDLEQELKPKVNKMFKLSNDVYNLEYLFQRESFKFSLREDKDKVYNFIFYQLRPHGDFFKLNENLTLNQFEIDGKHFAWKSLVEMESDDNTRMRNMDVLRYISSFEHAM